MVRFSQTKESSINRHADVSVDEKNLFQQPNYRELYKGREGI